MTMVSRPGFTPTKTGPKGGDMGGGFDLMLNAFLDVHPSDTAYARIMTAIADKVEAFNVAHKRMVQTYEDGMPDGAARYAKLASDAAEMLAALHAEILAAFLALPVKNVYPADRHPANQPSGYVQPKEPNLPAAS